MDHKGKEISDKDLEKIAGGGGSSSSSSSGRVAPPVRLRPNPFGSSSSSSF